MNTAIRVPSRYATFSEGGRPTASANTPTTFVEEMSF